MPTKVPLLDLQAQYAPIRDEVIAALVRVLVAWQMGGSLELSERVAREVADLHLALAFTAITVSAYVGAASGIAWPLIAILSSQIALYLAAFRLKRGANIRRLSPRAWMSRALAAGAVAIALLV